MVKGVRLIGLWFSLPLWLTTGGGPGELAHCYRFTHQAIPPGVQHKILLIFIHSQA